MKKENSEKTGKKKHKVGKIVLLVIVAIIAVLAISVGVLLNNPKLQMKIFSAYVMSNLSKYNWSALQMEDPVHPILYASLGEEKAQSVEVMYDFMKDSAAKLTWETLEVDPEAMTSTVEVTYVNGNGFMTAYGNGLGDYIMQSIDNETMEMGDMMNVLQIISDEDNSALMLAAREEIKGQEPDLVTTTLKVNFVPMLDGKLLIPTGTSDEVYDVASAGLTKSLDGMTDVVAVRLIPQIVERVFDAIQTFNEEKLAMYTGKPLAQMIGMEETDPLYMVLRDYLKACATEMTYTVNKYDPTTCEITIDCSFLDSGDVIDEYIELITDYALTNFAMPSNTVNAELLTQAVDNVEKVLVDQTVTISFTPGDYGNFKVSDEIMDVVSANLNSELGNINTFNPLEGLETTKNLEALEQLEDVDLEELETMGTAGLELLVNSDLEGLPDMDVTK